MPKDTLLCQRSKDLIFAQSKHSQMKTLATRYAYYVLSIHVSEVYSHSGLSSSKARLAIEEAMPIALD